MKIKFASFAAFGGLAAYLILFIALACCLSGTARAQGLKPKLIVQGTDTSFCFSVQESKQLAKMLTKQQYERKELQTQNQVITQQQGQITAKTQIIHLQTEQLQIASQQLAGKDSLLQAQERVYTVQQKLISAQEKKLRHQRTKTKITGGLGILGIFLVLILH